MCLWAVSMSYWLIKTKTENKLTNELNSYSLSIRWVVGWIEALALLAFSKVGFCLSDL